MRKTKLSWRQRFIFAGGVALYGLAVSIVMKVAGGSLARFLPDTVFYLAAFVGAGVAGCVCGGGFGRVGLAGVIWAVLSGLAMTLIGALVGGALLFVEPGLGALAVFNAMATSWPVCLVWTLGLALVHSGARQLRQANSRLELDLS